MQKVPPVNAYIKETICRIEIEQDLRGKDLGQAEDWVPVEMEPLEVEVEVVAEEDDHVEEDVI